MSFSGPIKGKKEMKKEMNGWEFLDKQLGRLSELGQSVMEFLFGSLLGWFILFLLVCALIEKIG